MSEVNESQKILGLMSNYCDIIAEGFRERISKWGIGIFETETYEAIGGLLSRQVTLSLSLASSPETWNGHIAPLILRSMTDAHITLSWILLNPNERAKKYILYGLGQEKLYIENLKCQDNSGDNEVEAIIKTMESWLNSQRADYMTEVNVGSWSDQNTRNMAIEADCEGMYKLAYTPFSGAVHNMWQHISKYNLVPCNNPLHKFHRVPELLRMPSDPDYVYRSAKYLNRSLHVFDQKYQLDIATPMPLKWLSEELADFFRNHQEEFDPS